MTEPTYAIAPQGVYSTIAGESQMLGLPMIFVRLAGCPVGCSNCDTVYTFSRRLSLATLVSEVSRHIVGGMEWTWLSGGEPSVQDLPPLVAALHGLGLKVAVATAGIRPVQRGHAHGGVDFLSVSPHRLAGWVQRSGDCLNLVPGLNGLRLADMAEAVAECAGQFTARYVTPCDGKPETLAECLEWVRMRKGWRLGVQAHKTWGLP